MGEGMISDAHHVEAVNAIAVPAPVFDLYGQLGTGMNPEFRESLLKKKIDIKTQMLIMLNTERNILDDNTTWTWYLVPFSEKYRPCFKLEIEFLDENKKPIPGTTQQLLWGEQFRNQDLGVENQAFAYMCPGMLLEGLSSWSMSGRAPHGVQLHFLLILLEQDSFAYRYCRLCLFSQQIKLAPSELKRLKTMRCRVLPLEP